MTERTERESVSPTTFPLLLNTKIYRPPVSADLESRADLIARLEGNQHRALTLISAPTGYGKSTLASMWLDASEAPGCWVSLDEGDDDPRTFLAYMVAAIHSAFPDVPLDVQTFLETSLFPPPATVARTLLNDLARIPHRFLLAVDDLHVIRSQVIYSMLAELLRHPSPKLHLVLISRRDPPLPLPFLRAHHQLTEIRTADLRFSSADTAGLLTKMLHREIDEATAAAWAEQTEGWVTALSLAAIYLRQHAHSDLAPDDGAVDSHYLQEYLLAEVINHLDPILREWLLAIAWLDRFCPALCSAVYQVDAPAAQAEQAGQEFIQQLERENLFVIRLDNEKRWFRLHHLFRKLLRSWGRNLYQPDEIAAFHHRAGAWFAHQEFPDEAIRYLVLAGDIAGAEQVVMQHRYALMNSERWHVLERWLHYFPDSALDHSALLATTAAILAQRGRNFQVLKPALQKAEQLLANLTPNSTMKDILFGELSVIMSTLAIAAGNVEALTSNARRGLQLLPANALDLRAIAWGALAAGMQMSGQSSSGYQLLREKISEPEWGESIQAKLMSYLCMICVLQGDLTVALEWADRVQNIGERLNLPESLCQARYFIGVIHYLRGESDAAEPHLSAVVESEATSSPTYLAMGAMVLTLIRNERGDVEHADAIIDRLTTYFRQGSDSAALALLKAFRVELALRRGSLDAARRQQVGVEFEGRSPIWFFYIPQLTPVKLLLAEGTPEALAAAHTTLDEFEQQMSLVNRNLVRIEALALLALVYDAQGDMAAADARLTTALVLAQEAGIIRSFVDLGPPMADLLRRQCDRDDTKSEATAAFVTQILAAFPTATVIQPEQALPSGHGDQTASVATLPPEPLTARELEILQQLTTDRTPAEIAARNVVSVSTVRSQIKSIYRKLDVNSRMEAVNRSRDLNIL